MPKMNINCEYCGREYQEYYCKLKHYKSHYCSMSCSNNAKKGKPLLAETKLKLSIAHTGSKHWNYGNKYSDEFKKKLSIAHMGKKLKPETKSKLSLNNAKYWQGRKHSDETKQKIRNAHKDKKLSLEHRLKISESAPKGELNHAWMGGVYPQNMQGRHNIAHKEWSNEVLKRDKFRCFVCNESHKLVAHHLTGYADNHEKRYDIDNGITLCRKCHLKLHKGFFSLWL